MKDCFLYDNCNHKDCEKEFCLRKFKLETLYNAALVSDIQRKHVQLCIDADGTDYNEFTQLANIEQNILDFVQSGKNLYLHSSNCGNGKTSWSLRLLEAYFNKIWPKSTTECQALFISVPKFLLAIKDNISNFNEYARYIQDNVHTANLVIWDDIATKISTEYELSHLMSIIDSRINLGKANIYTSNLNPQEMTRALGERLVSRVCMRSIDIELHGGDKRQISLYDQESNN